MLSSEEKGINFDEKSTLNHSNCQPRGWFSFNNPISQIYQPLSPLIGSRQSDCESSLKHYIFPHSD